MRFYFALALALTSIWCIAPEAGAADEVCGDWSATVVSVENDVEIRRDGDDVWTPLQVDDSICLGDSVRIGFDSRTDIQMPDDTHVRADEAATFTFLPPQDENRTWLELIRGIIYVVSRDPNALKIVTPFVNAGLEGTEFLVAVDDEQFELAVYEGTVALDSASEQLAVGAGSRFSAERGVATGPVTALEDRADLRWAQHYPLIIDDLHPGSDPAGLSARAQTLIRVGRLSAARANLASAQQLAPDFPTALALEALIVLNEGDTAAASALTDRALQQDSQSVPALLVRSYVLMQQNLLRDAVAATDAAVRIAPQNAVAQARHAETLLAIGDVDAAFAAANRALALNAGLANAHVALGFAHMAGGGFAAAIESFETAIRLDSAAAIPRVGLAIALTRTGNRIQGRKQIESAVALQPNDSVIRSYMGKAYADEFRDELAGKQLNAAKGMRADDATPLLYGASLAQTQNRPITAQFELMSATAKSAALPFRSALYQDEDLMIRGSGIGAIWRQIGAEDFALLAGSRALMADPAEYSAHRFVSDISATQPRREVQRFNEALQARVLQPLNVRPFSAQLAEINQFIGNSIGPTALEHGSARSGFASNGLSFEVSATAGSFGTRGENIVLGALTDNWSFNLGHFLLKTDGFRDNNDFEQEASILSMQTRLSADTSIFGELRSSHVARGDTMLLFDPARYQPLARTREDADSAQIAVNHRVSPSSRVIASLSLVQADLDYRQGNAASFIARPDIGILELQHLATFAHWNIVSGVRATRANVLDIKDFSFSIPVPPFVVEETSITYDRTRHLQSYVYINRSLTDTLVLTLGGAVESVDTLFVSESHRSPKVGLSWNPRPDTSLHFAAFETLQGQNISRQLQLPSLEPTQVAGIGQFWNSSAGEIARNYAVTGEHGLTSRLRVGFGHTERSLDTSFSIAGVSPSDVTTDHLYSRESMDELHLLWTPSDLLALGMGWESDDFSYRGFDSPYLVTRLQTERLPLQASAFFGRTLSWRTTATHIRQDGVFLAEYPLPGSSPDGSRFWNVDTALDIRLPNRRGSVEVSVRNLFDDNSRFQNTDPENPEFFPERFVQARFTLSY